MTKQKKLTPDYLFEYSWEVCNQVGGIYTVLSSRAHTMQEEHKDKVIFIGPDFWQGKDNPLFVETPSLLKAWRTQAAKQGIALRIGRWNVPGRPIAVLVDFQALLEHHFICNVYGEMWRDFGVSSICSYQEYDECAAFGIAAGRVIESFLNYYKLNDKNTKITAHFNEWQTAFGLFYVKKHLPQVATLFTTHATSIGRSIAGNNKPLYEFLHAYNGDQMARELNVEAKHSAEKVAAHVADCFTTVSDITAKECEQLLDKKPDIVTPNGFENGFVPSEKDFDKKRKAARAAFVEVAEALLGYPLDEDAVLVGTSGRYEYKNKGIDVFIDSLRQLANQRALNREVVGFVIVPAHISGARADLQARLADRKKQFASPLPSPFVTHTLYDAEHDAVLSAIRWFRLNNAKDSRVKIVFIPSYLNGADGIFNKTYYDLLIGLDITVFPSYYEPWGYTPLESIAFSIPTVTTDLSGFGQWIAKTAKQQESGVMVAHRTDYNYHDLRQQIYEILFEFAAKTQKETEQLRQAAQETSQRALWERFFEYYRESYHLALGKKLKE